MRLIPQGATVKEVDGAKLIYSFKANVAPPRPAPGTPPPAEGAEPPPPGREISVQYTFLIPEPSKPAEGEEPKEVDMAAVKEAAQEQVDRWKSSKGSTFVGEISGDGLSFNAAEQPIAACCPEAPLTPEEVASDAQLRAAAEAELAEAAAKQNKKGRGR